MKKVLLYISLITPLVLLGTKESSAQKLKFKDNFVAHIDSFELKWKNHNQDGSSFSNVWSIKQNIKHSFDNNFSVSTHKLDGSGLMVSDIVSANTTTKRQRDWMITKKSILLSLSDTLYFWYGAYGKDVPPPFGPGTPENDTITVFLGDASSAPAMNLKLGIATSQDTTGVWHQKKIPLNQFITKDTAMYLGFCHCLSGGAGYGYDGHGTFVWLDDVAIGQNLLITGKNELEQIEKKKNQLLSVSPNPAKTEVSVRYILEKVGELKVFDLNGRLVISHKLSDREGKLTLDTQNWPRGLYMLQLVSDNAAVDSFKLMLE